MVAIFQVLYASYTLYKTRGDQLSQYGYAAFGLTVIPYIIMSFLNLLGNLSTPNYLTLYLIGSPELEEAKLQDEAALDGLVGSIVPLTCCQVYKDQFPGRVCWCLSDGNPDRPIYFAECSPFETIGGKPYRGPKPLRLSSFLWWGFMVLLGTIPYGVIGGLTHFQAAQSTAAQRVLTMFWLASGVFIGAAIPFISFSFQEMLEIIKGSFSQKARKGADEAKESAAMARSKETVATERAEYAKQKAKEADIEYKEAMDKVEKASASLGRYQDAIDAAGEKVILAEKDLDDLNEPTKSHQFSRTLKEHMMKLERRRHQYQYVILMNKQREGEELAKLEEEEARQAEKLREARVTAEARAAEESEASSEAATRAGEEAKAKRRKAKEEENRAKALIVFLVSLMFCAGAISGFVVVGQMLKEYGSCILLS